MKKKPISSFFRGFIQLRGTFSECVACAGTTMVMEKMISKINLATHRKTKSSNLETPGRYPMTQKTAKCEYKQYERFEPFRQVIINTLTAVT